MKKWSKHLNRIDCKNEKDKKSFTKSTIKLQNFALIARRLNENIIITLDNDEKMIWVIIIYNLRNAWIFCINLKLINGDQKISIKSVEINYLKNLRWFIIIDQLFKEPAMTYNNRSII